MGDQCLKAKRQWKHKLRRNAEEQKLRWEEAEEEDQTWGANTERHYDQLIWGKK